MLVPFFRTILLYIFIVAAFRLMGKRQVAEMQATEFVITILISAVASVPMQDLDIPLLHGLVPILTLIAAEIFLSVLSMRSQKLRQLLSGKPVQIIRNGVLDQQALRKVRMTLDDVFETLRLKDVFDLRSIQLAQVETNGQVSLLLFPGAQAVTLDALGKTPKHSPPLELIISDGVLCRENLKAIGRDEAWLHSILKANLLSSLKEVFLLCADRSGSILLFRKEGN